MMKIKKMKRYQMFCSILVWTLCIINCFSSYTPATVMEASLPPEQNDMLTKSKKLLTERLIKEGVLNANRGDVILKAPIGYRPELNQWQVALSADGKEVSFAVPTGYPTRLKKELEQRYAGAIPPQRESELFICRMAGAVAQADLLLASGQQEIYDKLPAVLKDGLSLAMEVSSLNILLDKKLSLDAYAREYRDAGGEASAAFMAEGDGASWLTLQEKSRSYVPGYGGLEKLASSTSIPEISLKEQDIVELLQGEGKDVSPQKTLTPDGGLMKTPQEISVPDDAASGILEAMKEAQTQEDFLKVIPMLSQTPDPHQFSIKSVTLPRQIPFDQLSSEQSSQGACWYTASEASVYRDSATLRYERDILYPAYQAFFRKVAGNPRVERFSFPVHEDGSGKFIQYDSKAADLLEQDRYTACIVKLLNVDNLEEVKKGDSVMIEISAFSMPMAYKSFFCEHAAKGSTYELYLYMKGATGKMLDSGDRKFTPWPMMTAYSRAASFIGWSMGMEPTSATVYLTQKVTFRAFPCTVKNMQKNENVSFEFSMLKPESRFEHVRQEKQAVQESELAERRADHEPGVFMYLLMGIFLLPWVALPYMIYVLVKESRRRFKEIPLPAGWNPDQDFDSRNVMSELEEFREFLNSLEQRELDGEMQPFYTRRQEVDRGYTLIRKLEALPDKTPETIVTLNRLGNALNEAQRRVMYGSKWVLAYAVFIFAFFAVQLFFANGLWAAQLWISMPFVYYLALRIPMYKLANPEPAYYRAFQWILKLLGVGSLVAAVEVASDKYATIYRDSYGNLYKENNHAGCAVAIVMVLIVLLFSPFLLMLNCICNFLRNYVTNK